MRVVGKESLVIESSRFGVVRRITIFMGHKSCGDELKRKNFHV